MRLASVSWNSVKLLARVALFSSLFLVVRSAAAGAQPWTAVSSTGVVVSGSLTHDDCADQAIGFFRHSPIVVNCLAPPVTREVVVAHPNLPFPPLPRGSGRVVYNVVFEPDLGGFGGTGGNSAPSLTVRYLVSDTAHQHITVRLIQQPRNSTSTAVDVLLTLNSDDFPALSSTQTQMVESSCEAPALDFETNAYYITADISNANATGGAVGVYQVVVGPTPCIG
jgi:hypothetical protein